jgi:hypothetical protein
LSLRAAGGSEEIAFLPVQREIALSIRSPGLPEIRRIEGRPGRGSQ